MPFFVYAGLNAFVYTGLNAFVYTGLYALVCTGLNVFVWSLLKDSEQFGTIKPKCRVGWIGMGYL